jgi:hypothetical protein
MNFSVEHLAWWNAAVHGMGDCLLYLRVAPLDVLPLLSELSSLLVIRYTVNLWDIASRKLDSKKAQFVLSTRRKV